MSETLKALSNALADTVEATSAGIVRVDGRKRFGATGIVWNDSGIIVTANHVVRRDEGITVNLPDGNSTTATLVGRAPNADVAVLKVDATLTALPKPKTDDVLRVGNLVLAVGRPRNSTHTTLGVVSSIGSRRMEGLIQTDVVMYPGFSGGPLMDASGQVRGMNTSGFNRGASVAIANSHLQSIVDNLLEHGKMRQGYLGVGAQPVRLPEALAKEFDQETGLMLASVESNSPAEAGGLLLGDIIISLDGEPTPTLDALLSLLGGTQVGKEVPVRVVRGGQTSEINVTIGERE
ncbi:MAG: trypsin-like peptidase domain-containing protein [Aggregatilineales bacterium]